MPLYTAMTQDGLLSAKQRDVIAAELVRTATYHRDGRSSGFCPLNFFRLIRETTRTSPQITRLSPLFSQLFAQVIPPTKRHGSFRPSGELFPGKNKNIRSRSLLSRLQEVLPASQAMRKTG